MKYYLDITLLQGGEDNLGFLWQKIYQQLHLALVENKCSENSSEIGVSFPEFNAVKFPLGNKLRLFAKDELTLKKMDFGRWFSRFDDYILLSECQKVPELLIGHACFEHIRLKGSKEKLARRRASRHNETFEKALAYYKNLNEQCCKQPYIITYSQSNKNCFSLFIEMKKKTVAVDGLFSCYGFSNQTTVPLF